MSFSRYPEYKDSGVEWLGEVPKHWSVPRLSWLFGLISSGTTPPNDELNKYYEGDVCWVTTGELRESTITDTEKKVTAKALTELSALRVYPVGTLLIALYGATIGRLGFLGIEACTNQACCALADPIATSPRFIFYTLLAAKEYLLLIASGGGQPNINQEKVRALRLGYPAIEEQIAIVHFLDHETAKIDSLIAEQEKLIELLKEKRQAVISHAVTKGLDPKAKMKDSGVEWLGEVPEHWIMTPLKHISPSLTVGIVVNPSSYVCDEGLPFIYGGDIQEGKIDISTARQISAEDSIKNDKTRLMTGDLLTVRVGYPGITAVVTQECEGGNCASVMHIRRGNFDSNWLCYVMNSRIVRFQVEVVQYGAAQEQFNISHAVEFEIPTPDTKEQIAIATFLDRETAKINELISEARSGVELLKERRSALISAAVTGKIDVRECAV